MLSSDFHCKENERTIGAAHLIQTFLAMISWYQGSKEPGEPQESGFSPKKSESSALLQSFHHFPYNENQTRTLNTTSLKCCLSSTDAIDRQGKKFTHVYEGSRSPYASALHWNPPGFRKTRSSGTLVTEWYKQNNTCIYTEPSIGFVYITENKLASDLY